MKKFYGFILIPSGILWIVSFIHSLVLEKSNFMKENQFDVNSSTIYLFLLLFICWILLMFIFLKDDNRPILKKQKQKQKKESLEDDLFLD